MITMFRYVIVAVTVTVGTANQESITRTMIHVDQMDPMPTTEGCANATERKGMIDVNDD